MVERDGSPRTGGATGRITPRRFAMLYLLLALPMLVVLNLVFPSFHAPDDTDHVTRASTIITGQWLPTTPPGRSSGAFIDPGLKAYMDAQIPVIALQMHPLNEAQKTAHRQQRGVGWQGGGVFTPAPAAMSYLPLLYMPQAAALGIGQLAGASVETSVLVARLANGLAGALLVALGLRLLPLGHALVIVTMLLPKSLLQFASNSADPILLGASVVLVAAAIRVWRSSGVSTRVAAFIGSLLLVAAAVRPPLIVLGAPFFLKAILSRSWSSLALLALGVLAIGAWFAGVFPSVVDLRCGAIQSAGSKAAAFALHWPELIARSIVQNHVYYVQSFIGEIGWGDGPKARLDVPLPLPIYLASGAMLVLAIGHDRMRGSGLPPTIRIGLVAMAGAMAVLVFFAMYTVCTASADATIHGVQGRYLVPSVVALAPAITGGSAAQPRARVEFMLVAGLILWCAVNLAVLCVGAVGIYWRL